MYRKGKTEKTVEGKMVKWAGLKMVVERGGLAKKKQKRGIHQLMRGAMNKRRKEGAAAGKCQNDLGFKTGLKKNGEERGGGGGGSTGRQRKHLYWTSKGEKIRKAQTALGGQ